MNKRKLHHWLVVVRQVKTWQLVIVLIVLGSSSAYLLRQNNLGMVERRNAVKQADASAGDVAGSLTELQNYVYRHMNTGLGEGIFLEHTYQRAYDRVVQAAAAAVNPNSVAYQEVEAACRQEYDRSGSFAGYISCVQAKLKALSPGSDPMANVKAPPTELFTYNFISPLWSFDAAGLTVLATLLAVLLLVLRISGYIVLRLLLKLRNA